MNRRAGLCEGCGHLRTIESARGSTFYLCEASRTDTRLAKYPPIPVLACPQFEARAISAAE